LIITIPKKDNLHEQELAWNNSPKHGH